MGTYSPETLRCQQLIFDLEIIWLKFSTLYSAPVNNAPADDRIKGLHLQIAALVNPIGRLRAQQVRVQYGDVSQFALCQSPFDLLLETGVGRTPGVGLDCFFDRQTFGGEPSFGRGAPHGLSRDRRVEPVDRTDRVDRGRRAGPVCAEAQSRALRLNGFERVCALAALVADALLHPAHVVAQVEGLNFGDHPQALQAVEVALREDLRVNQSHAAVARTVGFGHRLDHVEHHAERLIADGVNRDL